MSTGGLVSLNLRLSSHRQSSSPSLPTISSTLPSNPSSQNPNSSKFRLQFPSLPVKAPFVFTALALGFGVFVNIFTGFGGGIFGRGGGSGGGNFWSKIYSFEAKEEETESLVWDSLGLSSNVLNNLSRFKKYKVPKVILFDEHMNGIIGSDDSFNENISLRPGGIYTKVQLQKEPESLSTSGLFEKVDIEADTKPDGTIGIKISFAENTWQNSDKFRCINVGLLPAYKVMESRKYMTEDEEKEFTRVLGDYKRKMDTTRPCLLPPSVHKEVLNMLGKGQLTAWLLQKIRIKVEKWYQDNGYLCAQVMNFGNLNTREHVCEVVEGDITHVVL